MTRQPVRRLTSLSFALTVAAFAACSAEDSTSPTSSGGGTPVGGPGPAGGDGGPRSEAGTGTTTEGGGRPDARSGPDGSSKPDGDTAQDSGFVAPGAPRVFFSDLDSGPNTGGQDGKGAFITLYGAGFGSARGTSTVTVGGGLGDSYPVWTDTKITIQLGALAASGDIVVHNALGDSNSVPFTVRAGRVLFVSSNGTGNGTLASPMSPADAWSGMQAGDTYYFRAGTYGGQYGSQTWARWNMTFNANHTGSAGTPIALSAYPDEAVTFTSPSASEYGNFGMVDENGVGNYITIANFTLQGGGDSVGGGGWYSGSDLHPGALGIRVVGNVISTRYSGSSGGSGAAMPQNDHWRILGNEFKNIGDCVPSDSNGCNLNHAIYAQLCSSDLDIGWNYFHDLIMGHVVMVHMDIKCSYYDVRIHDNVLVSTNAINTRGISLSNMNGDSYGSIYNNILYNLGQNFAALSIYNGNWKVYNNTFYNIHSESGILWLSNYGGGAAASTAQVYNNIFYSEGPATPYVAPVDGASWSQLTVSNNLYFNNGSGPTQDANALNANPLFVNPSAGDFHLQANSPAVDHGSAAANTVVVRDRDGTSRPQGAGIDIGAYER